MRMMSISSKAGKRLAKARMEVIQADLRQSHDDAVKARQEFLAASIEVANDLCDQGFHLMEGD
jgi:hypothetical protein